MRLAAVHDKEAITEPTIKGLGDRINNVTILNERDCIKVKPKMWLEREKWAEINGILRMQRFGWLPKARNSCWIRLMQS
jgi:hypothetical protein